MSLSNLANASNEKREQTIMICRKLFNNQQVVTVKSVANHFGVTEKTAYKYGIDGNIPLLGDNGQPIVPITIKNKPKWL